LKNFSHEKRWAIKKLKGVARRNSCERSREKGMGHGHPLRSQNLAAQNLQVTKMVKWYTPAEVLKLVSADNAELVSHSVPRNAYPGKLGVIEEGALADLLLVNVGPIADIIV
jgi:imidazolonepropionase-like amidohydrolase